MSTRLSWTDVEAIVRIADADPDPELREVATDTLAWLPLDEATGRRVLGVLADEAPAAWRDSLDHHLWLLGQETSPGRDAAVIDRPDEAMTAIVLLPDHLFDDEDVVDLSVLRGLPDVPAQWLLTNLLRRLFSVPADDPALDVAVARIQRIIDFLPDAVGADLVLAAEPGAESAGDRHALAGAALAVARPAAVLAALLPWLRSHTPAERLDALRTLRDAARFLGQPQLFGTSTPGPRDALASLADLLRRAPGTGSPARQNGALTTARPTEEPPDPQPPPQPPSDAPSGAQGDAPVEARPDAPPDTPPSPGAEFPDGADGDHMDEAMAMPAWSPPAEGWTPPPAPPPEPPPPAYGPAPVQQPVERGGSRRWWPFRRRRKPSPDEEIDTTRADAIDE